VFGPALDINRRSASVSDHMHELAIAQSALQQVLREAERAGARRVTRIVLRIGSLSGVETEALRFAFDALLPTSPAAAATVVLETVPALAGCRECGHEFAPAVDTLFECPRCHAFAAELRHGRELDLVRIDCN
jgi:hydrogenase nickel incorporation protein HypA/HybF